VQTIRIQDHESHELLAFDLKELLAECGEYSQRTWIAWLVDWSTVESYGPEVLEYFLSVCHGPEPYMTAPNGQLVFTFSELQGCARCVSQTENGFFMARRPELEMESIPPLRTLADCERIGDLIIHAFDFSFWEVTTEDENLIQRLASKYKQTTMHAIMMEGGTDVPRR
jgi:hypothetical protein